MIFSWPELIFWGLIACLVYVYAGFALLVVVMAKLRRRAVAQQDITPRVSLIIAAWNEAAEIAARIENALASDYPPEKLEVIIASDGSTDATNEIARTFIGPRVRLLECPRRGKIHALNAAVAEAHGDILVFSDANTMFAPRAVKYLVRNFADESVGGVCGNKVYRAESSQEATSKGENLYWNFDKWLKTAESATGSIVAADGAIYAVRRMLYDPPHTADVTDDFAISTAVIARGYRLVYEPEAVALEKPIPEAGREFRRKVRLMNRGLRSVLLRKKLLNPFQYGFYAIELFSHKVLRRLVPAMLMGLFLSNLFLLQTHWIYLASFAAQISFYGLAWIGYRLRDRNSGRWKVLFIPFFYCLANAAALLAILKLLAGKRISMWQPQRH